MNGFEIICMAPASRRHKGELVLERILQIAKDLGINRYTRRANNESVGLDGRYHSVHFFELADEPEELSFILNEDQADGLLKRIAAENLPVFCLRRSLEFFYFGVDDG